MVVYNKVNPTHVGEDLENVQMKCLRAANNTKGNPSSQSLPLWWQ